MHELGQLVEPVPMGLGDDAGLGEVVGPVPPALDPRPEAVRAEDDVDEADDDQPGEGVQDFARGDPHFGSFIWRQSFVH